MEVKIVGLIFFIFGCAMLMNAFIKKNKCIQSVEGKVINLSEEDGTYFPIFQYIVNGYTYVKESRVGSNPSRYKIGQNVKIYFNPENPEQFYDKSSNKLCIIFGIIFAIIGAIFRFAS